MRPVQPNRDTSLSTAADRTSPQLDNTRRVLRKDGLHLGETSAALDASADAAARELGVSALLASARHELRSPLQAIQGFADLLAAETYGALGDDQRVFVEHIIQGSADLSRVLDACFDLVQAELSHADVALGPVPFRRALEDSIMLARSNTEVVVECRLAQVPPGAAILADSYGFAKAVGAIVTALAPATRGPLLVCAAQRDGKVEILFGPSSAEQRPQWRSVRELSGRGPSARALLWLRLASALLERGAARLDASEGYDRIRVMLPLAAS